MPRAFPTTCWTIIREAQGGADAEARLALGRLLSHYWRPVYWTIRREWNEGPEDAADLTQEYLTRFVEQHLVEGLAPQRGRFRSWMKATLRNFLLNHRRHGSTQKRGGAVARVPLEEIRDLEADPPTPEGDPRRLFEQELMRSILRRSLADLEAWCGKAGKGEIFRAFRVFYLSGESPGPSYKDLEESTGLDHHRLKNGLAELRMRYRQLVLQHLRDGVSSEEELAREIREVFEP